MSTISVCALSGVLGSSAVALNDLALTSIDLLTPPHITPKPTVAHEHQSVVAVLVQACHAQSRQQAYTQCRTGAPMKMRRRRHQSKARHERTCIE